MFSLCNYSISSVMSGCDNLHFLFIYNSCNMDIQPNQTSFGSLEFIEISEVLGGKDLVTLFGRSTRFSGSVTREPVAKPATNFVPVIALNRIGGEWYYYR